ncbi:B domain-containing protein [Staphylococcus schleiferi]|uniref:B domain-containing protein n=1 Tax=Staphylococcus schleiferi TaxID=1295 RepID=UPI001888943F|nr:B domain-containing protein [Staphylococcus schleiferi]MBF1992570.1 B domain-containing protein [Staphylococcus schleiferi]MBF2038182.1 B domain-containing protein [Staphylococcus schleiferi]MBF2100068.1 B domain-containing protein [Staphylococcus schleiferi]MBF2102388.1 B domain-containing protein [Staphylococcus schleiferi]MBF2104535.1 B domain-containing protein [Staphylococcus schleiferi]
MKNKYIAKLLMGVATVSIATIVSNGQADASEQVQESAKSGLAPAATQTFESAKVSPEQKAFYQVLYMEGITDEQRDQYLKQLHEDKESAQNVYSESIKDSLRPERRVGQQNAFYEILNNEDITDEQRDRYISQIKENPDASQKVFDESVNQTETKPAEPQIETKDWEKQWQEQPQQEEQKPEVPKVEEKKEQDKPEAKTPEVKEQDKPKAPKVEEQKEQEAPEAKTPEVKKEEQKPEAQQPQVQKPEVQHQGQSQNQATPSQPSAPAVPKVEAPSKPSTWTDYWNSFKRPFENGYTYIKDSFNNAKKYVTDSYKSITEKYNNAKYYSKLYFKYKDAMDIAVLALLNDKGANAYITPIKIDKNNGTLYNAYAKTSNFVTSGINTGKVLYTLYQKPQAVKAAITTVETAQKVKNAFSSILSIFK